LRLSGLPSNARNLDLIDEAVSTLRKSVRAGDDLLPAPITAVKADGNRLRLEVCGDWLAPPYGKVPMPLPTRSAYAMALYLFVHTIRAGTGNTDDSDFKHLCARLGIRAKTRWQLQQPFDRALAAVNQHFAKLDPEPLAACGIKSGQALDIIPSDDDPRRVRLVMTTHHTRAGKRQDRWKPDRVESVPGSRQTFRRIRKKKVERVLPLPHDEIEVNAIKRDAKNARDLYHRFLEAAHRGNQVAKAELAADGRMQDEDDQDMNWALERQRVEV
jgi:hypothetical protein